MLGSTRRSSSLLRRAAFAELRGELEFAYQHEYSTKQSSLQPCAVSILRFVVGLMLLGKAGTPSADEWTAVADTIALLTAA